MKTIRRQYGMACLLLWAVCLLDFLTESLEVVISHADTLSEMAAAGIFWQDGASLLTRLVYHLTVPLGHALLAVTAYRGYRGRPLHLFWEIACGVCSFHWLWLLITHCVAAVDGITAMWYVDVCYAGTMVLFWVLYGLSARAVPRLTRFRRRLEYGAILFKGTLSVVSLVVMVRLDAITATACIDWMLHLIVTAGLCAGLLLLGAEEE